MNQPPPAEPQAGAAHGVPPSGEPQGGPLPGSTASPHARAARRARNVWTPLSLVLALAAIAFAGFSSWQFRVRIAAVESDSRAARAELEAALDDARASAGSVSDRLAGLGDEVDGERERLRDLGDRLDALPGRVDALEQRVEADTGSSDARSEWLRAEAEYYLGLANAELALAGRWQTAIAALELADERLRALSDPSLTEVRRLVADELQQLKSVRLPDVEGLALELGQLAERVDELPLRRPGPADGSRPASLDAEPPGLGRLWQSVKRGLLGLVQVERTERPSVQMLSAEEGALARRQLAAERAR
ncbi:MAG TPA: uroporphyrinogen-III C-methyltransferase, partial [Gammaproteobacteria bacterium]|nr:uroporphyrinogen-III C-methyltransferase [Gammaproteobacteria bacterium]